MNYRDRLDIIADILMVASPQARKTQIMYQANLSYKVLQKYLDEVIGASLLDIEEGDYYYKITEKGLDFLKYYQNYSKHNEILNTKLDEVNREKKLLEQMCSGQEIC